MVKKMVLALLIAATAAGGAFAQASLSAGFGGTFRANFSSYAWTSDGKDYLDAYGYDKDFMNTNRIGGGFFAFFDASYVALSLGMGIHDISPANSDAKKAMKDAKQSVTFTTLDIGVLGKIPIDLGGFTLFPALGVDFRIPLDYVVKQDGTKSKWSDGGNDESITKWMTEIWFKLGIGADIPLGEKLYLRPMFLYGIGTLSKTDKETSDYYNESTKYFTQINHGFDLNIALGFKF